ncbi:MAG: thioredoxin family protein [Candidatus Micrarchaeota archaeon]|nr:thioredoxin family protein [Candidatus Micrarchaeota archaeon]
MVLCFVALFIFTFLSIFSARYRPLAAEAFDCTFRKLTLRKCKTGLDERIKSKIVGKLMNRNEKIAKFVFRNFEFLSIVFSILFFASMGYSIYSAYNFITYGTCDPISGSCIFVPYNATVKDIDESDKPPCGLEGFIEFYGEGCPHCERMKPIIEKVEKETGVKFIKLEIFYNETNRQIMFSYADSIKRDCEFFGTPTFYSIKTNRAICGEVSEERLKRFILENG